MEDYTQRHTLSAATKTLIETKPAYKTHFLHFLTQANDVLKVLLKKKRIKPFLNLGV